MAISFVAGFVVATVNCAPVNPAPIVTLEGSVADALLEVRLSVTPPAGAFEVRNTNPIADCPPKTT
jgi:hypothetical protein